MKTLLAILVLATVAGAQGITIPQINCRESGANLVCFDPLSRQEVAKPKPEPEYSFDSPSLQTLTCPKYQHVVVSGTVTCRILGDGSNAAECKPDPPDVCVDDLHMVTEREWQELKDSIPQIEGKSKELRAEKAQPVIPGTQITPTKTVFHNCSAIGGSGNSPHLFDVSEIYKCDEGTVEIAGHRTMTIEHGYVFTEEMGKPSYYPSPHKVTASELKNFKWCPNPQSWDPNQKEMCGDKPTTCWDGKPGTWDPEWHGYSCATPDHDGKTTKTTAEHQVRAYYRLARLDYNAEQPPESRYAVYVGERQVSKQCATEAEAWKSAWDKIGGKR